MNSTVIIKRAIETQLHVKRHAEWMFKRDGSKGMRMGGGEGSTMSDFIVCTVHLI